MRKVLAALAGGILNVVLLLGVFVGLAIAAVLVGWGVLWMLDNPTLFQLGLIAILSLVVIVGAFVAGAQWGMDKWG